MRNLKTNIKKNKLGILLVILSLIYSNGLSAQQLYPASFDVSTLNGTNGFVIPGLDTGYKLGRESQFIGDINNDGFGDICIGNGNQTVGVNDLSGRAYVIFGSSTGFSTPFDLTSLNGANGFIVEGVAYDERRGTTVAGPGDINGDGIDDLIIGTSSSSSDDIVIYGAVTFPPLFTVNDINGTNGFLLDTPGSSSVAALGDVNGDSINDFIIGTPHWSGQSWIVFGRTSNYPALITITWLDGVNGFRTSSFPSSRASYKVGGAGDINNDGINDMLVGSWNSTSDPWSYAFFGKNTPFSSLENIVAVDGTDGFKIDNTGNSFITNVGAIGDVNNDGIDDCFSENNIIFGSNTIFSASLLISDFNGTNGFVLNNYVLSAAPTGDINNDGIDDFIVSGSGDYVVFGKAGGYPALFDSSILNGVNGFQIPVNNSNTGRPVDGGKDVNGDGVTDFIFGDTGAGSTGEVYVVFGGDHYAMPLTTSYPQANNETTTGFDILVNGPEIGTIHYAILPGSFSGTVDYDVILTGTGAVTNGNFLMSTANTDIAEVVSSLTAATTYDIYLFLEDTAGNKGIIYHLNDITTLSGGDITPPSISCPANQTVTCGTTVIPDYKGLVTTTDIVDASPVVTQSPVAGAAFVDGMIITMTSTDASLNSASCTFNVSIGSDNDKPTITCLTSESLFINSTLPNYFFKLMASDNCTSIFNLTYTQVPVQGTPFTGATNITVSVTDENGNTETCLFPVTVKAPTPPIDCNTTSININNLDGNNGFQIDGDAVKAQTGHDVRGAGDINGDGIQDFLVGSPNKAYNFNAAYGNERGNFPGNVFVVFGKGNNFLPNLDTALLDGTDGFKIHNDIPSGGNFQYSGYQVSTAGDINNDGIDDLMFSDPFRRNPSGSELGTIYVVFGKSTSFSAVFNLSSINGINGFVFLGTDAYDQSGKSIDSAGDINNDGINDIIIGASTGRGTNNSGTCYVVYGKTGSFPALIKGSDLNGTNGFIIKGDADGEQIGFGVVGLGDVNGDGIDDVGFEGGAKKKTYVLFGKTGGFPATVATVTINGTNGFYADISFLSSSYYRSITGVGDVNNDGINDMLFGHKYLLFGKNTGYSTAEDITSLDGIKGVEFTGSTYRKSSAGGDFNNDGIDDLIVGYSSSSIAIVYGKSTPWNATLNPFSLPVSEAFKVYGLSSDYSVSNLADINGDGITDVIVGEKERLYYDSSSSLNPGRANVIYGFSITDTEAPVVTCPTNQILVSGSLLPDYTSLASLTDNCDANPVITQAPIAGSAYTPGMTITITATDKKGNSANCSFIATDISDTIDPTATNPLPINVQCLTDVPAPNPLVVTDEADNSGTTPTVAFVSDVTDGNSNPEIITRTYSVTDTAGNSINVTQSITVNDIIDPTATNPTALSVSCVGDIPVADIAVVTDEADNCTGTITVAFVNDVNTSPSIVTRTYSVTDTAGNSINVTQSITVNDIIDPTATNPTALSVSCVGDIPVADISVVTDEADNCTGTITVAFVNDVNTSPIIITRTYSVTDAASNSINVTQTITVNDIIDPTATNPTAISVSCVGDIPVADNAVVTDEADNCTGTITVAFVNDVNTSPSIITRTYSVTDTAGNSINVTQTITINDIIDPTATNPTAISVSCVGDIPVADISVVADEADNCTGAITVAFVNDVNTSLGIITRTYSVTDTAGNSINVTQTITVNDIIDPTATNPTAISVSCVGDIPVANISVVTDEADNCTGTITVAFVNDVNTSPSIITRTYSVTDTAGNSINVTQSITVNDIIDPTATNPTAISVSCVGDIPVADISVVADEADNCTGAITVAFVNDVNTSPSIITRTYSVTDTAGNSINVTQSITVNDTVNPVITCPSDRTQKVDSGLLTAVVTYTMPTATDNCSVITISQTAGLPSGAEFPIGINTISFEVTDTAGNNATCSFDITIEAEAPFTCTVDAGTDFDITKGDEVELNATISGTGLIEWSPSTGLSSAMIANPIASPTVTTTYILRFTNAEGCIAEDTVTVFVTPLEKDETKYGFSPNGDGINDYWEIKGIELHPDNVVTIYNRWGDVVYQINGYDNISRVFRGEANKKLKLGAGRLPSGTYFFNIHISGEHNFNKLKGFLVLKR